MSCMMRRPSLGVFGRPASPGFIVVMSSGFEPGNDVKDGRGGPIELPAMLSLIRHGFFGNV